MPKNLTRQGKFQSSCDHALTHTASYDASDKNDQPTHPVIFTKRATSIIGHKDSVLMHTGFTESPDYEGEIGVIIGKAGFRISEADAMDYVWGYTIINDLTARERQRDHKQFFIGKSPDTFCPMGPVAVPKEHLPDVLEITTYVNGEKRQNATTKDLIFSIPVLVKTISEGQTLQPGDVIATGTPAGVGFGFRPMVFLKPGDEMKISVTGLGSLINTVAPSTDANTTIERIEKQSHIPIANDKTLGGVGLTQIGSKKLFYRKTGSDSPNAQQILFVHGLGRSSEYFTSLVDELSENNSIHLTDLEGHGLSPTSALSRLTIQSFADDLRQLMDKQGVSSNLIVVAHSMGCHIAVQLVLSNPSLVSKLVLMGPPRSPLPEAGVRALHARAALARSNGMSSVVDAVIGASISPTTYANNQLAVTASRLSLLGQDPEGYAKACTALASADGLDYAGVQCSTLILTGSDDKDSPPDLCEKYRTSMPQAVVEVLPDVGHWHLFEASSVVIEKVTKWLA